MKTKVVQAGPDTVVVAVLDPGDDAVAALSDLARERRLASSQITAVGAFERAVVGWFDRAEKEYRRIPIDEQCEVLSLVGDIAESADGPQLHTHAVLGLSDGTTRGGHLLEGLVWPTLEVVIRESPTPLHKTSRPEIGLALIDLDADGA
jgi:hypothetical protein